MYHSTGRNASAAHGPINFTAAGADPGYPGLLSLPLDHDLFTNFQVRAVRLDPDNKHPGI